MTRLILLAALTLLSAPLARADTLTCAAEPRPGFADSDDDDTPTGTAIALCAAIARAAAGPDTPIRFTVLPPDSPPGPEIDIAFISPAIATEHRLTQLRQGPAVLHDPIALMVPTTSPAQHPADLAGATICLMTASTAQRALEDTLAPTTPFARLAFREDIEMFDAYNVSRCDAVVDTTTRLNDLRAAPGINHLQSRLLTPPLADDALYAYSASPHLLAAVREVVK